MRVANLPNGDFLRDRVLRMRLETGNDDPAFVGALRIAGGGRDLYEALEADGRVAVHDIHFDTDAATIRPESADTLNRIGDMLDTHPDLNLLVEGHTDATGDFDHNMDLSKQRAESVKAWLVTNRGIEADRLRCLGLGQTQPKDTNDSEVGRQKNRRVELVRL
jgi:outer membrane protein OmpA-like peptidoglycan-associated protein